MRGHDVQERFGAENEHVLTCAAIEDGKSTLAKEIEL